MIEIKDLLLNLNNILLKDEIKKAAICEAINKTIGTSLSTKDIKIKNNIVYLNIKPIYKNEVLLKKDLINFKLKESLGEKIPKDIR